MLALLAYRAAQAPPPAPSAAFPVPRDGRNPLPAPDELRRRLAEAERAHGGDSLEAIEASLNLATALLSASPDTGRAEAGARAERAASLLEAAAGNPRLGVLVGRAAYVLSGLGRFQEARPLVLRSISLNRANLGPDHFETAGSVYLLADLERLTGAWAEARRFYEEAIAIWEARFGPEPPVAAPAYYYLGFLSLNTGDFQRARALMRTALAIRIETLGTRDPLVGTTLNALGALCLKMGDLRGARSFLERALENRESSFGPDHSETAQTLSTLTRLAFAEGDLTRARALARRVLEIRRLRARGTPDPLVAIGLNNLAEIAERAGDTGAAELYEESIAILSHDPALHAAILSSTLAAHARAILRRGDRKTALAEALRAESLARTQFQVSARGLDEEESLRFQSLRPGGLALALEILAGGRPEPGDVERTFDEVVRSRALVLDQMLARTVEGPGDRPSAGLDGIRRVLEGDSALVAFVRHSAGSGRAAGHYSAFIVSAKDARFVPVGPAEVIEPLVHDWLARAGEDPRRSKAADPERDCTRAGARLRTAVWDPIARQTKGARRFFIVPDGAIHLLNLAALPSPDGSYLVESGPDFHYLPAERDLLAGGPAPRGAGSVLVVGAPDFDRLASAGRTDSDGGGEPPSCPAFKSLVFDPLPGSGGEADEIAIQWHDRADLLKLTGAGATEAAFRQAATNRSVLHLGTHGFFLRESCQTALEGGVWPNASGRDGPLRLTGLAFAGANHRAQTADRANDGILTAEEIAALDLRSAEWAVLSACDSGRGETLAGEGVLGLRWAFRAAGVRTLIMSLWAVDDGAARMWMRHLYAGRLSGLSTLQTVRAASLAILGEQRRRGQTTHPFFWGAFVAAGDWR